MNNDAVMRRAEVVEHTPSDASVIWPEGTINRTVEEMMAELRAKAGLS